jgi:ABC-type transporter lipoprotein component MlaA
MPKNNIDDLETFGRNMRNALQYSLLPTAEAYDTETNAYIKSRLGAITDALEEQQERVTELLTAIIADPATSPFMWLLVALSIGISIGILAEAGRPKAGLRVN